jgi:hypothetical protein
VCSIFHRVSQLHQWPPYAGWFKPAGALTYFGLDAMGATEKKEMQSHWQ